MPRPDATLREAADTRAIPGVVAIAATADRRVLYQGAFGRRDLSADAAMTPDAVLQPASATTSGASPSAAARSAPDFPASSPAATAHCGCRCCSIPASAGGTLNGSAASPRLMGASMPSGNPTVRDRRARRIIGQGSVDEQHACGAPSDGIGRS
jgi:hypothetical protein